MDRKTKALLAALSAAGLAAAGGVPTRVESRLAEPRAVVIPDERQRFGQELLGRRYSQLKELPVGDPHNVKFSVTLKSDKSELTADFFAPELHAANWIGKGIRGYTVKSAPVNDEMAESIAVSFHVDPTAPSLRLNLSKTDMHQYLIQNLDLSKEEQDRIAAIKEVRIVRQAGEDTPMLPPTDPISALTAVAAVLRIIDSLTGQWDRIFKNKKEETEKPHAVTASQEKADAIVVRKNGTPVETITVADIAKLDANSRALIKAIEDSMQRQFNLWTAVYPSKDASADPVVNAQVRQRLDDIARVMCSDLGRLFQYLDTLGKHLDDHYNHIRFLCQNLSPSANV